MNDLQSINNLYSAHLEMSESNHYSAECLQTHESSEGKKNGSHSQDGENNDDMDEDEDDMDEDDEDEDDEDDMDEEEEEEEDIAE